LEGWVNETSFIIYVVDDDASIRKALERLLGSAGYQTLTFDSAEALLAFPLQEGKGCLILDIRLPGMTGFELQEKLSSRGSKYPLLFMMAHDNPPWRERAKEAGAVAYLKKPFGEKNFLRQSSDAVKRPIKKTRCGG
jgi:FixJ family two-component response regulator